MIFSRELKRGGRILRLLSCGVAYALTVAFLAVSFCLSPAYAFTVSNSYVPYVRIVPAAAVITLQAAARQATVAAVGVAVAATTPAALTVLTVASGLALGVALGTMLWNMNYTAPQLAAIKTAAATPSSYNIPTVSSSNILYVGPYTPSGSLAAHTFCNSQTVGPYTSSPYDYLVNFAAGVNPAGYTQLLGYANGSCVINAQGHLISSSSTAPTVGSSVPATADQAAAFVAALAPSDPASIESHTQPLGVGVYPTANPDATFSIVSQPVTDASTSVVPTSTVSTGDVVVAKDVPPPAGAVTAVPPASVVVPTSVSKTVVSTSTTTSGVTTTTSTETSTQTDTATPSCAAAAAEVRTFASVLQTHMALWQASGLLASIASLKNLVFTGEPPTLSLTTHRYGNHSINFATYNWVYAGLKTILIAFAGMAAIRIVFVGG